MNVLTTVDGNAALPGFQPVINAQDLRVKNVLYELGAKFRLLENQVFYQARPPASLQRTRTDPFTFCPQSIQHEWLGVAKFPTSLRCSSRCTPTRRTRGAASRISFPIPGTKRLPLDQFALGIIVDGQSCGTGLGSPNRNYNPYVKKTWRVPGVPATIVNIGSTYLFKSGFGGHSRERAVGRFVSRSILERDAEHELPRMRPASVSCTARRNGPPVLAVMNLFDQRIVTPA